MIEKIMKAVKSGNKKRGRNITVGAVVGMLLSCTAVMGADEYLWIKNDGGIKYNTAITSDDSGADGNWQGTNPYNQNEWNQGTNTYINNMILSSSTNNGKNSGGYDICYALKLSGDLNGKNFINNGSITATSTGSNNSYGIYNGGTIGDIINTGLIGANTGSGMGLGIFNKETKGNITNIKNIGLVAVTGNNGIGIYSVGGTIGEIKNIGLIMAIVEGGYGIYLSNGTTTVLTNEGLIIGVGKNSNGNGIGHEDSAKILINSGSVIGTGKNGGTGIALSEDIPVLTNTGLIMGKGVENNTYGAIGIDLSCNVTGIVNVGSVIGRNVGTTGNYGIQLYFSKNTLGTMTNTGVVYGKNNVIHLNAAGAIITSLNNYGILATEGDSIKDRTGTITTENNYGLYITGPTGVVTVDSSKKNLSPMEVVVGYDESGTEIKRNMTIKNANILGDSGGTSTDSFAFASTPNEFDNSILNGKNDTLKVSGTNREVKGSIINAYGTAIVFDGTDSQLTLLGTIVNGGTDGTSDSITGSGNGDTLILQAGDITYVGTGSSVSQNTVVNGNIDMKAGDDILTIGTGTIINGKLDMGADNDTLTIKKGAQINGTLDGGSGDDTLDFGGTIATNAIAASNGNEIRIQHDILNYEIINVNSNVTLFEKTVGDDGSLKKLDISGVNEINISAGSVLNLRIDTTETNGRYEGHALFGNTALTINGDASKLGEGESITESENGTYAVGVLNLVTNGLGLNSIIAMDGITLDEDLFTKTNSILDKAVVLKTAEGSGKAGDIRVEADKDIFREVKGSSQKYEKLNDIYNGVISSTDDNFIALKNIITINSKTEDYTSVTDSEQLAKLLAYLGDIYTGSPYSYSSELSRKSAGMFRDIVTENEFRPNQDKWLIMGGFTHADGGTKDTYYGRNYHGFDTGTSDTKADMKLTGAYMLAKYGYSENTSLGLTLGGNKSEAEMSISKVKGNSGYLGVFVENYRGNLTLKAGAGVQYSEYDADRRTIGGYNYNDKYSDMTYDIYLNGRYSHNIGDNLFLEPYATLSYTYIDQDGANEGSKALAIETDSKSFDYTVGKVGVDLKKVIPHEKGKSTLSAGVSYTRIFDGAEEEYITGRFKGGSDFDILVAHKNEHSIGLNAKYALELENGVIFDVKGTYSVERDSHNQSGKNKTKGEWIVGAGLGYKF